VVVNMASLNGQLSFKPLASLSHTANKAGIIGMTHQLALEGSEHGIRVNSISPGPIESGATRDHLGEGEGGWAQVMADRTLLGRLGKPEGVANVARRCAWFSPRGLQPRFATSGLPGPRVLTLGTISMIIGLALLVTAVRLSTPSLALFLGGGVLIGAGSGAVFKGTTSLVLGATAPENRLAATSDLLIALYVGLSLPVIGAGVALDRGASPSDTVLVFAIVGGLGVAAAGALLGRGLRSEQ
jgi:Enoyl-(Acyl carrier protein) reductase